MVFNKAVESSDVAVRIAATVARNLLHIRLRNLFETGFQGESTPG